ncbi:MAG: hypothetical protein ACOYYU_12620 [Chloroflexota bacterium]
MSFTIKPIEAGKSLLDEAAYCPEHDCPMIPVLSDGQDASMCLFDIVEQLLGGQRVKYVKTASGALRSIRFENGYILEPLCACCGKATLSGEGLLENKILVHWAWEMEEFSDGDYPALMLDFARSPDGEITDTLPLHINSIVGLRKIEK